MDAVKGIALLAWVALPGSSMARQSVDPVARWQPIIAEASTRFGVPAAWIERVIRAESGGQTILAGKPIRSRAGAIGLMQLMPATWSAMRDQLHLGADPDDPHDNIIAGTAYLRVMADRFGYPGLFAAYNAGPGHYAAFLAGRSTLQPETIAYLATVTGGKAVLPMSKASTPPKLLFALRQDLDAANPTSPSPPRSEGLFAIRKGIP